MPIPPQSLQHVTLDGHPATSTLGFMQPDVTLLAVRVTFMNHERFRLELVPDVDLLSRRSPIRRDPRFFDEGLWVDEWVAAVGAEEVEFVVRPFT